MNCWSPALAVGLIPARGLAGYRNDAVFLRTSLYVPPRWEALRDAMPALFDLLEREADSGVRAVLGTGCSLTSIPIRMQRWLAQGERSS